MNAMIEPRYESKWTCILEDISGQKVQQQHHRVVLHPKKMEHIIYRLTVQLLELSKFIFFIQKYFPYNYPSERESPAVCLSPCLLLELLEGEMEGRKEGGNVSDSNRRTGAYGAM